MMEKRWSKGANIFCWFTILFVFSTSASCYGENEPEVKDIRKGVKFTQGFLMPMVTENAQGKEFPIPEPYDLDELYEKVDGFCNDDDNEADCYKLQLIEVTKKHGARAAIDLYKELMREDGYGGYGTHHIAHHIGYYSAITFGAFPEIAKLCTDDFHYGCVHGFYQGAALSKQLDPQMAKKFTDDLAGDASLTSNYKLSLYHGLGHAHMVNADYDIQKALDLCALLDNEYNEKSCRGGMFMENEDCSLMGDWEKCGYSKEDPTLPCSQLPLVYQDDCYFNHVRWLLTLFDNNYKKVIDVCENIPDSKGDQCLQYLISTVTQPGWQQAFIKGFSLRSAQKTAAHVCQQFPNDQLRGQCVRSTIDNSRINDKSRKINVKKFCKELYPKFKSICSVYVEKVR